jgi:hypothetical protein
MRSLSKGIPIPSCKAPSSRSHVCRSSISAHLLPVQVLNLNFLLLSLTGWHKSTLRNGHPVKRIIRKTTQSPGLGSSSSAHSIPTVSFQRLDNLNPSSTHQGSSTFRFVCLSAIARLAQSRLVTSFISMLASRRLQSFRRGTPKARPLLCNVAPPF